MAKLKYKIPARAWEICRDRIAEILADELNNQIDMNYLMEFKPEVCLERYGFDNIETEIVNVMFAQGRPDNKDITGADGAYLFNIDLYTKAETTDDAGGDQLATLKLHTLLGLVESILDHPNYKTLGFAAPYICRVWLGETNIAAKGKNDQKNVAMGRIQFNVLVFEKHKLTTPRLAEGFDTSYKIGTGDKGYKIVTESYN